LQKQTFYNLSHSTMNMDIISQNFKTGIVKLKVSDVDDLWYLSHLIDPGDFVKGKTTRKIRIGEDENAKVTKKTMTLLIEAENIDFGKAGDTLRINGKVKEGPEEVPKDSYHSLSLEKGSEFTITKVNWRAYQKQKLKEASEKKYNYLLCVFDREEAIFALTQKFGYKVLVKITGEVPKKTKTVEIKSDFYEEIIKALDVYAGRYNPENIIIASPAFYKEDLLKKIKSPELRKKIVLATTTSVNENSLDEVLKRPELAQTLQSSRSREEQILMDELLAEINKNNLASYGLAAVQKAVEAGAVKMLLISDEFIFKQRESAKYDQVDEMMKTIDALQGEIHILSSENEAGKKLNGLGGIAVILRYKLAW